MTWLNPVALAGILAVGLPIVIHLLNRDRASVEPFPTLRFLRATSLEPTRRARLSDVMLLALRIAVIVAAAVALAQPVFSATSARGPQRVRAVVVDTSASMRRTAAGGSALDAARRFARALADTSGSSLEILAGDLPSALHGAAAWLATQTGIRELIVVSDFQDGAIDSVDVRAIPADVGLRLNRIVVSGALTHATRFSGGTRAVTASADGDGTRGVWQTSIVADPVPRGALLAGVSEQPALAAALAAVGATATAPQLSDSIVIVFPRAEGRQGLVNAARPIGTVWMARAAMRMRMDSTLRVAADLAAIADTSGRAVGVVLARTRTGSVVAFAAEIVEGGRTRLAVFSNAAPGSFAGAALLASAAGAVAPTYTANELAPDFTPDSVLQRWSRAPSPAPGALAEGQSSFGRFLWAAALLLLGAESVVRRRVGTKSSPEVTA